MPQLIRVTKGGQRVIGHCDHIAIGGNIGGFGLMIAEDGAKVVYVYHLEPSEVQSLIDTLVVAQTELLGQSPQDEVN